MDIISRVLQSNPDIIGITLLSGYDPDNSARLRGHPLLRSGYDPDTIRIIVLVCVDPNNHPRQTWVIIIVLVLLGGPISYIIERGIMYTIHLTCVCCNGCAVLIQPELSGH